MKNRFLQPISRSLFLILVLASAALGQRLVSSELNGVMSAAELNEQMTKVFGSYAVAPAESSVELYKITYTSLDARGRATNLTGLAAVPSGGAPKGLVVYCHGTTVDRLRSPSRYTGKGEAPETIDAILGFATGGYVVVLPDYIGLGDHKAAHPYPLSKVNARSGVDIIPAVRTLARAKKYSLGTGLFITGYSEGGGVAMALTQALQAYTGKQYRVTRSAPAAGPYDLSGTTRRSMLEDTGEQVPYILRIYLTSYAVNFIVSEYGLRWRDFYRNTLANDLALVYRSGPTDDGLIKNIGVVTTLLRTENKLSNTFQPTFLRALQNNDRRNIFVRLLQENNTYNWTPRVPMLLIAIDGDTVVSQENTNVAYETMRRRGVTSENLRRKIISDPKLNHLNGIAPAMSFARRFFDSGFAGVPAAE